jgi:hypothetical protein
MLTLISLVHAACRSTTAYPAVQNSSTLLYTLTLLFLFECCKQAHINNIFLSLEPWKTKATTLELVWINRHVRKFLFTRLVCGTETSRKEVLIGQNDKFLERHKGDLNCLPSLRLTYLKFKYIFITKKASAFYDVVFRKRVNRSLTSPFS